MPRKRKPLDHDPGLLARTMLAARHAAGLNAAKCAELCGLSTSFLHHIEKGDRTPTLSRIPAIAAAYKTDPTELCWVWLLANAPEAIRYLARTDSYEDSHVLKAAAEQRYVPLSDAAVAKERAKRAAESAERAVANKIATPEQAAQVARTMAARARQPEHGRPASPAPTPPDFDHSGGRYRPVGELDSVRDSVRSALTPRGGVVEEPGAGKRK